MNNLKYQTVGTIINANILKRKLLKRYQITEIDPLQKPYKQRALKIKAKNYFYLVSVATYTLIMIDIKYIKKQQYLIFLSNFLVIIRTPKIKAPESAKEIIKKICYPSIKYIVKKQKLKSIMTISMMRKQCNLYLLISISYKSSQSQFANLKVHRLNSNLFIIITTN
ncbi:unnamed protein product [Paramecium pentaurelia]|uniref:Uncharacterized protein n=1 Tax=Paramecium pentaurelia TaxID=43138 RepID=A0A8S1T192_9CILI|nr:unnamed protein product [Paramecium pentaurelia]